MGRTGELLARALRDPGSVNLYRALLWGALRRKDRGEDRFEALWNALERVLTDLQEGFAKKPGALLIARLRESGLWALLLEGPQYRVAEPGVRPARRGGPGGPGRQNVALW